MPIYIAYDINDISNFIKSQNNLCGSFNLFEQSTIIINKLKQIKYPKVLDLDNDSKINRLNSENGWQLVESVIEEVFKITIFGFIGNSNIPMDKIKVNMFKVYKENNILPLFYENYCKYFSFSLMPEFSF